MPKGAKHGMWKGGVKHHSEGYRYIWKPDHPACTKYGYVFEHRLVMERYLGRYITEDENIHHKNGIKTDNRIENLQLCESNSKHRHLHTKDMSDRFCLNCGNDKTYLRYNKYQQWLPHPITKERYVCSKCYTTIRRKIGLN